MVVYQVRYSKKESGRLKGKRNERKAHLFSVVKYDTQLRNPNRINSIMRSQFAPRVLFITYNTQRHLTLNNALSLEPLIFSRT